MTEFALNMPLLVSLLFTVTASGGRKPPQEFTARASTPKQVTGFTINGGDSTVTMFDLKTFAVIQKIPVSVGGMDGITYDEPDDKTILTDHSRPVGTLVAVDPQSGDKYTVTETVATFAGIGTTCVDPKTHYAYLFQPEPGPALAPPAGTRARRAGTNRGVQVHHRQTVSTTR